MIWLPWRKPKTDERLVEAEKALEEAKARKAEATSRSAGNAKLTAEIRELRQRNGFGEAVWAAMGGPK